jgi:hypothetical protein
MSTIRIRTSTCEFDTNINDSVKMIEIAARVAGHRFRWERGCGPSKLQQAETCFCLRLVAMRQPADANETKSASHNLPTNNRILTLYYMSVDQCCPVFQGTSLYTVNCRVDMQFYSWSWFGSQLITPSSPVTGNSLDVTRSRLGTRARSMARLHTDG